MSFSSLAIPSTTFVIINSGSINLTQSVVSITGSNQIFDWITINSSFVYPGEVYYKSSGSGNWHLASTATSESIQSLVMIEEVMTAGSGSILAKGVYFGNITFDSGSIDLIDGNTYYLATSSNNTQYQLGPYAFRNTTSTSPSMSKTIFVATSDHSGVILNYRGYLL